MSECRNNVFEWIKADEDSSDDEMSLEAADDSNESANSDSGKEEFDTLTIGDEGDDKYDATIDMNEEELMLKKYKEAQLNQMFPDEVDTPMDVPAKTRFARYRGLKSFRTSPWDPKENLPSDYARIFQFENFRNTKKKILREESNEGAMPGWFVRLHIVNVPKEFMESYKPGTPVVIFGMLPHEQKLSVVHFLLKRHLCNDEPIRSKELLVFHVGFRRFIAGPIYSQHTSGDKHKFERYLRSDEAAVATVYAPITYPPSSVMVFKQKPDGSQALIATGSLLSVNPDRIISKRVVLSGHPFKINKKSAVVRYMFFNREDILWFKPVELRTKYGRKGHIKEPLGTHGHMKCVFDSQLKSQDTVLMNLYKRVFPKWTYNPHVLPPPTSVELLESLSTGAFFNELMD